MKEFTLTREEMLELAKLDTFHLDDRLCPFSREDLRAEAWLQGYLFARRHQKKEEEEIENEPQPPMPEVLSPSGIPVGRADDKADGVAAMV